MKKSELKKSNQLLHETNLEFLAENQKLKSTLEECQYNIKGLIEENSKLKKVDVENSPFAQGFNKGMAIKIENQAASIKELREENKVLKAKINVLELDIIIKDDNKDRAIRLLDEVRKCNQEHGDELDNLKDENNKYKKTLSGFEWIALVDGNKALKEENAKHIENYISITNENGKLKSDLRLKEQEITKLKSELYFTGDAFVPKFEHQPTVLRTDEEGYVYKVSYIDLVAEVHKLQKENSKLKAEGLGLTLDNYILKLKLSNAEKLPQTDKDKEIEKPKEQIEKYKRDANSVVTRDASGYSVWPVLDIQSIQYDNANLKVKLVELEAENKRLSGELKWAMEKLSKDFKDRGYVDFEKENIKLKSLMESAKDFYKDEVIFLKEKLDKLSSENRELRHFHLKTMCGLVTSEGFIEGYQQAQKDFKYMQSSGKSFWRIFK